MFEPLFSRLALFVLWSSLIVVGVACRQQQKTVQFTVNPTPQSTPSVPNLVDSESFSETKTPTKEKKSTEKTEKDRKTVEPTFFEMGLDRAAGGFTISQSAQSPEDWKLVADHYQDAINLMKTVQPQSRYYPIAKSKVREYQRHVDYALEKSVALQQPLPSKEPEKIVVKVPPLKESIRRQKMQVPPAVEKILQQNLPSPIAEPQQLPPLSQPLQPPQTRNKAIPIPIETKEVYAAVPIPESSLQEDNSQDIVFRVPIKRRIGGTPIIDVNFNGKWQFEMIVDTGASGTVITQRMARLLGVSVVGKAKANTASAKSVEFPIGYVDSIEAGGVRIKQVQVAIAGSELENGLLGHDFFGNYDITFKRNVVEFRPRANNSQIGVKENRKSIPIYPKKLYSE